MSASSNRPIVSLNISPGREFRTRSGRLVKTGIFKEPVPGPLHLGAEGVEGDLQADRKVHGGRWKAVYAYDAGHYPWWREQLGRDLPYGMFGENLTIAGLNESEIRIGDRFTLGAATLQAVQPRQPCFKLGVRFDDPNIVNAFLASGRWGVYFQVVEEGEVRMGDTLAIETPHPNAVPIGEIFRVLFQAPTDLDAIHRILEVDALPPEWRQNFEERARLLK